MSKIEVTCAICNKVENKNPCDARRYKTCSLECRGGYSKQILSTSLEKECEICGELFKVKKSHFSKRFTCGGSCKYLRIAKNHKAKGLRGESCHKWKGGRFVHETGYVFIHAPENAMANSRGYVREHRLVMANYLGRPLERDEIVHHIDGNKENNDVSNLQLMDNSTHAKLHNDLRRKLNDAN
ncbi:HNH endonuclease [Lysinibacillus sp. NPDC093712]|uniref:HNH endonuclease n=1 Tax=Lysinibacillus sp. NPDC093712 TaxID=3390579 RepID=UPI003D0326C5